MNALALLHELDAAGVAVTIDDQGELRMRGRGPRRDDLINQVRAMKPEIMRILARGEPRTSADWRAYFDERAAIAEFDGRLCREKAERLAAFYCRQIWYEQNPPPDPGAGHCCHCGRQITGISRMISTGSWMRWLHAECEVPFADARRRESTESLAAAGIGLAQREARSAEDRPS